MSENGVYGALVKAQEAFPAITRDRTVKVKAKSGAEYTFAYAPLDSIMALVKPVLAKNGLAVTQPFGVSDQGGPLLETMLVHEDGSMIRSSLPLPVQQGASAQELGSLITYCRRYAIVALLGLATEEDDDANHASGNAVQARQGGSQSAGDGQTKDTHGFNESRGDNVPGDPVIHFSKNKGKRLSELNAKQLEWYATTWVPNPEYAKDEDWALKAAAEAMHLGVPAGATFVPAPGGGGLDDDIPFMLSEA